MFRFQVRTYDSKIPALRFFPFQQHLVKTQETAADIASELVADLCKLP